MNIANVVKNCVRNHRMILKYLLKSPLKKIMSDKTFVSLSYKFSFGRKIDLENPQTFNEKLQWLKLYDRKDSYTAMVDKYEAKKYVADRIGEEYIIPTLGVYDSFEKIDFDALTTQFVLKCTHDSGGLVICRDKEKLDKATAKSKIEKSLKANYFFDNREWPYKNVRRRIIAEKYLEYKDGRSLFDYKFYCFDGKPKFLYVSFGLEDHSTARISFYDLDLKRLPFKRSDFAPIDEELEKPCNFDEMIKIAEKLSEGHSFLRVDLYNIDGRIYFSELTFFPCSGRMKFDPPEWDKKVGDMLTLPKNKINLEERC